jgi:hypothetical protein
MKLRLGLLGIVGTLTAVAACSSSSSSPAQPGQEAGTDADGAAGDSGLGTEPSDAAVAAIPSIMCGGATCIAPSSVYPLSPCCLPDNGCGASFGAAALAMFDAGGFDASGIDFDAGAVCIDTAPGTPDPTCPSQTAMGFKLSGCCSRSKVCGVDLSVAGLGCESLSALAAFGPAGAAAEAGISTTPQACGGAADGGVADAGGPDGSASGDGGH